MSWLIDDGGLALIFSYTYIVLIELCLVLSLTTPVDRAVPVFLFLMFFFGVLVTIAFIGILAFLVKQSFWEYDDNG